MKMRKYGETGQRVSELGFGTWQLGNANKYEWGDTTQDPIRLVHSAIDLGVNFFDSALNYGQGASMECLGKALVGKRNGVVINTKFGHNPDGEDFSHTALKEAVEKSLRILKTDYIDSVLLHSPKIELCNGGSPLYPVFEELVKEGKILAYGASLDDSQSMKELISTTQSGIVMPLYNINFQESGLAFKEAAMKNIGVIAKVPMDSGWLTGKYNGASVFKDIRSRWSVEDIQRRSALQKKLLDIIAGEMSLHEAALSFILAQPEVTSVIPGIKNEQQLVSNITAASKRMNATLCENIREFYNNEIAQLPLVW